MDIADELFLKGLYMSRNVTIVEIAKESGVSTATVSRVLSGSGPVSPKTKARVEEVVRKYGYCPNPLAQGLILRQSRTLGMIIPNITNPYFSTLVGIIERAAHEAHYSIILCITSFTATSHKSGGQETEEDYFQMILDKKVDGVIIAGGQIDLCEVSDSYKTALEKLAKAIPVVVIGQTLPDIPCCFVNKEHEKGMVIAVRYLASLGHRRIGFAGGEPGIIITESRLQTYRAVLEQLGLDTDPDLVSVSDYYLPDGYNAAKKLLELDRPVTAILAMNDNIAIGAIRAISDYFLSVPDDIALISCDQFMDGNFLTPRLTSLERHTERLALHVIRLLLSMIQGTQAPEPPDLYPDLIIRESSGKHL